MNADLIGDLLSDEYFIDILANRDDGLLEKLYNSFKNRANAKKSELGTDGIKYLNKLANKFGKDIDKRAGGVKLSQLGGDEKKKQLPKVTKLTSNMAKALTLSAKRGIINLALNSNIKIFQVRNQHGVKHIDLLFGGLKEVTPKQETKHLFR